MPGLLRKFQGLFTEKPPNFSMVTKNVGGSGLPSRKTHIQFLRREGISAVISLTEYPLPSNILTSDILYLHFPLKDHQAPRPEEVLKAVEKIEELVGKGHRVLVHCQAGYGRTGTVLAAYLMKKDGIGWVEALGKIRSMRPGSVERVQEKTLMELEKLFRADS